ncbi:MAG: beta-propeller fold lactonase family protein [Edaphobacter sp.]|uniref:lactonase family protein n=1 Tax=Edaphobacter sp. TaxID=1934404 RepID=UPI002383CCC9|nr:beta-propeller fold lactonase family protein [Edaphobacter sp.]MDE1175981.1 beta-propeller fold lactonase family protein [Edaphobacter sp.]
MPKNQVQAMRAASAVLLSGVLGLTACTRDYTVAYVYATASSNGANGVINEYAVSYQSGALVALPGSPVSTGVNPVSIETTSNGLFAYVINQDDSTVQMFAVGSGGQLSSKGTYATGTKPTALALDAANKFLYVTYTYQPGYSASNTGPGGISIFPINADNTLGTPTNLNIGNGPAGIVTTNFNNYVYVIDAESAVGSASPYGVLLAFSENATSGALTAIGSTKISTDASGRTVASGYGAGTVPSSIAVDPQARFLYITDRSTNQLYGNVVLAGGLIQPMQNSPFATGLLPVNVTVDPRGKFLYVANYNSNTVTAYVIDQSTGATSGTATANSTTVGTGPSCISIEPALGIYMYTANNLDNTTTGLKLTANNGTVAATQNSPYPASGAPTCIATVANGSHASQVINP